MERLISECSSIEHSPEEGGVTRRSGNGPFKRCSFQSIHPKEQVQKVSDKIAATLVAITFVTAHQVLYH
jgi:hypothetical protein